jgi:hypothetical protein
MSKFCDCCTSDEDWFMSHLDPSHEVLVDDDPDYVAAQLFASFEELHEEIGHEELAALVERVQEIYRAEG